MHTHEQVAVIRLASGPQKHINENKRFAMLVLGSFGCIVCSFSYAWNLISGEMQTRYNLSQRDLSSISTVGLVFQFGVLPYAFLFDYLGPIPISIIGTIYFPLGALLLALCFMGKIEGSVVRLCVFNAFMSCGCTMFDLTSCITVLSHFPTNRGPVTALLKTFTGLGTALVACLYAGYFGSKAEKYFFFLFALAIVIGALCIAFMRLPPYHLTGYEMSHLPAQIKEHRASTKAQYLRQEAPLRRFVWGFFILIFLFVFLPVQSAVASYDHLGNAPKLAFAIVSTVFVFLYLFVAAPFPFLNSSYIPFFHPIEDPHHYAQAETASYHSSEEWRELKEDLSCGGNAPDDTVAAAAAAAKAKAQGGGATDALPEAGETAVVTGGGGKTSEPSPADLDTKEATKTEIDYLAPQYQGSFFHNLTTPELWGLGWTSFVTMGCTFVVTFNATYLVAALQSAPVDSSLRTMLTVLNGVGSAVGRMLMAYFEIWTQKRKAEDRIPITVASFFSTGCVIVSCVLFLALPSRVLPLPCVIAAIGNGFYNGVMLLVTRTIYAHDPAKHYHFCFSALVFSAIVFNRFLYGEWYTVQADKQGRPDKMCYGKKCVLMPLVVMLGLSCSSLIAEVFVNLRYRSYCIETLAERARLRAAGELPVPSPEEEESGEPSRAEPAASSSCAREEEEEERRRV